MISAAWAHTGAGGAESSTGEWPLLLLLAVSGLAYAMGCRRILGASAGGLSVHRTRAALFAAAWLTIAFSLLTPLHRAGLTSFTAHMIEHELLMLVAAPLFAFSRPLGVLLWSLPTDLRHALGRFGRNAAYRTAWTTISTPLVASVLQASALWIWHVPPLFDRALEHEGWHAAQHLSLLFSSILFWWAIDRASSRDKRHGVSGFFLFFTSLQSGVLGALMAFAASPWYAAYAALGRAGALDAVKDQQLAGLIMWVPGGAVHALAALIYLHRWFASADAAEVGPRC